MPRLPVLLATTLLAAAVGGLAGAVFVATREAPSPRVGTRARPVGPQHAPAERRAGEDVAAESSGSPQPARGLTARIDDPDAAVRSALALELLRRGPDALAQARALRPRTPEGQDLQGRLTAALRKMQLLRRSQDYARLPEHIRLRLDLDAFASVVPERLLLEERLDYWQREVEAVRHRLERGVADPAEESLALLELAYAEREAGRLPVDAYAARAEALLPGIETWLAGLRAGNGVGAAELADLERQLARLR